MRADLRHLLCWCLGCLMAAAGAEDRPEAASIEVLETLAAGQFVDARQQAARLGAAHPDFRAGRALEADLLAVSLGVDPATLELPAVGEFTIDAWRAETRRRWQRHLVGTPEGLPAELLALPDSEPVALVAEMSTSRLYLFANEGGLPRLVDDYYMGIGRGGFLKTSEGDLRTPLGVYRFVRWIDGTELPDLYGAGAFPVDYPNAWDRLQGRTGHGIWLHGVPPSEYSRPPLSSEGCMTLANGQLHTLRDWIDVGRTPLIAVERIRWTEVSAWRSLRDDLLGAIEAWRLDWESGAPAYFDRYAQDFRSDGHDLASWLEQRRQFLPGEAGVKVDVRDLSLLRYAGAEEDLWHARFRQRYVGADLDSEVHKEQLWRRGAKGWEIVFEAITDV